MENESINLYQPNQPQQENNIQEISAESVIFPPKPVIEEKNNNAWIKSITSLALYLILGYYIFPSYTILLIITAIVIFHEAGHFFAMKYYHYNDLGIFFIPLLGAYVSGSKREVSQKQSAVILLAGPLPGILVGIILYLVAAKNPGLSFYDIEISKIASLFMLLNILNLIPVYPLDGGQLLNRVFLNEESFISKAFVLLSILFMAWVAWKSNFPLLYAFPALMLFRMFGDSGYKHVEKTIEHEGINMDSSYEDLPDSDYWKVRSILITKHSSFSNIPPGPPYEYSNREDKIVSVIQSLLHRHLIQDISLTGKFLILVIWTAAFLSPWLLKMDMSFFTRFGM